MKSLLGSCPKCIGGDLHVDRDMYGWYLKCLQCGYLRDLPRTVEAKPVSNRAPPSREKVPAAAGQ